MLDLRPIFLVTGLLLAMLGSAMLLPAIVDAAAGNPDWQVFLASSAFTLFVAGALTLANWNTSSELDIRQAFILITTVWIILTAFAALPLVFAELNLTYTDAFFEAMSGLTTTGSTVITGLDTAPPGILMWRALLQWLGGIGIIVMAIAVLPMLQVGGMQLFQMESSDTSEKILPRATQIVGSIAALYLALSLSCAISYALAGMTPFESIAHSMTTIATGGFSTSDESLGHFDSPTIETIATVFMVLGSLPFVLYLQAIRGSGRPLLRDTQVRAFLGTVAVFIGIMWVYQYSNGIHDGWSSLRYASFNVVSIITGTGYATTDYGLWGSFALTTFFCIMFIGGCAGSTTCGIKVFRFQIIYAGLSTQIRRILHPHGVFVPRYNNRPIPDHVLASVMSFLFLFLMCFGILALVLNLIGLDAITALSAAGTAIANVGPGLGPTVGPAGTFASLPDLAKWVLSLGMLLGRLELFTVLVLFTPAFWRS